MKYSFSKVNGEETKTLVMGYFGNKLIMIKQLAGGMGYKEYKEKQRWRNFIWKAKWSTGPRTALPVSGL